MTPPDDGTAALTPATAPEASAEADARSGRRPLPPRPAISSPPGLQAPGQVAAQRRRWAEQPRLGTAGLLLVLPVALLFAIGAGGAEPSLVVFGPLITFSLPVVAMIAFWWDDWPGTTLRASWSGWIDTVLVAVGAVVLAGLGQAVVRRLDVRGIFDPTPGLGHVPTFPVTMPLAGAAFIAMLQLTLVSEGCPLRQRLGRTAAGLCALAVAWAAALVIYVVLLGGRPFTDSATSDRNGLVTGAQLGAALTLIGAWQVVLFVAWRGWPVATVESRPVRLLAGNGLVLGGAALTYVITYGALDLEPATTSAGAGGVVAAGLIAGMLYEGAFHRLPPARERVVVLAVVLVGAAALHQLLRAYADTLHWHAVEPEDWVGHVGLNAIGVGVILHVAIGRRWPFAVPPAVEPSGAVPDHG